MSYHHFIHTERDRGFYLYLDWPGEVADIDEERNIGIVAEIKFLIGEAVLVLFYLALGNHRNLLSCLRTSCWRIFKEAVKSLLHLKTLSGIPKEGHTVP